MDCLNRFGFDLIHIPKRTIQLFNYYDRDQDKAQLFPQKNIVKYSCKNLGVTMQQLIAECGVSVALIQQ